MEDQSALEASELDLQNWASMLHEAEGDASSSRLMYIKQCMHAFMSSLCVHSFIQAFILAGSLAHSFASLLALSFFLFMFLEGRWSNHDHSTSSVK